MQSFVCGTRLCFGADAPAALAGLHAERVLLVTDPYFAENGTAARYAAAFPGAQVEIFSDVAPDPPLSLVAQGVARLQALRPDTVLALGGGSAIDCAKGIAALGGLPVRLVAVPTTSGSGSEVTSFAILTQGGVKHPLVDPALRPELAILDPALLEALPPRLIAESGMDAVSHCVEAAAAREASPVTDALAHSACRTLLPTLRELTHWSGLLDAQAAEIRGVETGTIAVGCVYGAYYGWLSRCIARFCEVYPGIEVQVLQGNSSQLTRAVCEHTADFCITSFREGDFDWIPLYADPMVAWLPPEHPLAGGRTFPLAAFATEPTIATYMHQDTDNARVFARAGITPNVRYTSVDSRATFAMVQAGLGVSLNNQLITRGWDTTGIVILPVDPPQYAEIGIAAPAPEELSPAAKRFLAFARQTLRTDPEAAELGKEQA